MTLSPESPSPFLLETGPTVTATGNAPSAFGVSLLLHVTIGLIGFAVGVREAAEMQVRTGDSEAETRLTLQASRPPVEPRPELQMPPRGMPDFPPLEKHEPVELPEVEVIDEGDLAVTLQTIEKTVAERARMSRGEPESDGPDQAAPPEPEAVDQEPAEQEPNEPPADAPAASSEATEASNQPAGADAQLAAEPLPTNDPPVYPSAAVAEKRQGRVLLKVEVRKDGTASMVEVLRTSGHLDLDSAAVAAVRQWQFAPATTAGEPVQQTIAVPVRFIHTPDAAKSAR